VRWRRTSCLSRSAGAPEKTIATIHDRHLVRKLAGEIEILLDEHDRQACPFLQKDDRPADILDDRRLDALDQFIENVV
jgi:hypothetical protein